MAYSDRIYRSVVTFFQFFSKGWGPVETYERLTNTLSVPPLDRSVCRAIVADHSHPVTVKKVSSDRNGTLYGGAFLSPLATYMPGLLPKESETVRFEFLLPKKWRSNSSKPVYIHLAGTGDHFFWRRRHMMGYPLLKHHGIGSLMIENPYYGTRKPRYQTRSQLHYVSDLFVMGLALILESMVLGKWLENMGMGPVGLTGLSMGGYNVTLTASLWPKPVAAVPCLSWTTASSVFTKGAFSSAVRWDVLEEELLYTKLGHNNRLRKILNFIAEKQRSVSEIRFPTESSEEREHTHPSHLPELSKLRQRPKNSQTGKRQVFQPKPETVQMLIWVLDYMTHINSYPRPISPELAVFIVAEDDMYVPRGGLTDVRELWPGCEIRMIDGGHISSHFQHRTKLIQAQVDAIDRVLFSRNESRPLVDVPSLNS